MLTLDAAKLIGELDGWTVGFLGLVAGLGVLGALARGGPEATADGPRRWRYHWLVAGPVGALVSLLVLVPVDVVRLVAQSLLGGYAARTILDGLDARLKAALESRRADENAAAAHEAAGVAAGRPADVAELRGRLQAIVARIRPRA